MGDYYDREQGCDFYKGEAQRFTGSEEVILKAYVDQEVSGNPLQVVFIEDGRIPAWLKDSLPVPLNDLAGWELRPGLEQQPLYMVYFVAVDYDGGGET